MDLRTVSVISNPPIVPLVAFNFPVFVTLNGALSATLSPRYIDLNSVVFEGPTKLTPELLG